MFVKKITYRDFNDTERTEEFYFNLTEAELAEMELGTAGGLEQKLKKLVDGQEIVEIVSIFKDIVLRAYGVKSDDGRRFIKNDKVREEFAQTQAYSDLFMELATDDKAAAAFIEGILPQKERLALAQGK